MESARAIKRRKIAAETESSPDDSTIAVASAERIETPAPTEPVQSAPAAQAVSVAQQIWREARAKSRGYAKRAKPLEAVEDGDNITVGRASTPIQQNRVEAKPGTGKVGRPRKHHLDPLRNQREQPQQQPGNASPSKSSAVSVKGFFKRFHEPDPNLLAVPTPSEVLSTYKESTDKTTSHSSGSVSAGEHELSRPRAVVQLPSLKQLDQKAEAIQTETHLASYKKQLDRRKANASLLNGESIFRGNNGAADSRAASKEKTLPVAIVVQASTPQKIAAKPIPKRSWPIVGFDQAQIACIQRVVRDKVTGKRPIGIIGLDDECSKVTSLVKQTVTAGESNSMLIIGARGSGKSTLVQQVIRAHLETHADDFHVVRLNGFLHTDDKIALREIWRQLGREMDIDEEKNSVKNYADTLTTLLALLSHPTESARAAPGHIARSVLFVIDEFDLFAGHPRQTLLYNLFDIAQSRKAPIAVIGLTTRIDIAESLEKRVKSRFSHRYVYLGLPKTYDAFEKLCQTALSVLPNDLVTDEGDVLPMRDATLQGVSLSNLQNDDVAQPVEHWKDVVEQILSTDPISLYMRRLYHTSKSVPDFLAAMILPFSTLPVFGPLTSDTIVEHFARSFDPSSIQTPDSKLDLLPALSTLQLALLVCATRLNAIYNSEVVSFVLAYEEYKTIASKTKLQASAAGALAQGAGGRVWDKDVARGAWEALLQWELIIEDGRAGGGSGRVDVGLEELASCGVDLGMWARWCREI